MCATRLRHALLDDINMLPWRCDLYVPNKPSTKIQWLLIHVLMNGSLCALVCGVYTRYISCLQGLLTFHAYVGCRKPRGTPTPKAASFFTLSHALAAAMRQKVLRSYTVAAVSHGTHCTRIL